MSSNHPPLTTGTGEGILWGTLVGAGSGLVATLATAAATAVFPPAGLIVGAISSIAATGVTTAATINAVSNARDEYKQAHPQIDAATASLQGRAQQQGLHAGRYH